MSDKIGCFIIDIEGTALSEEDKDILAHPLVGGVILFARNYRSRQQLIELCQRIRSVRKTPLLITVDQEGGRVQRFREEFTTIPPMGVLGEWYNDHPQKACQLARECGWLMATELLTTGVDLSFAPVLDLNKGINTAIGDRAFHANPLSTTYLAMAFMKGMHEAGMASTAKHFPGHGSVVADSHIATPIDQRRFVDIDNADLVPFKELIKSGVMAMMASHIIYPDIDTRPVGFSPLWLNHILRQELHFEGVIFSDDLNMEGANISTNYVDRVQAALEAGCDFTLLCNNRLAAIEVIDHLNANVSQVEKQKWARLKCQSTLDPHFASLSRWQQTVNQLQQLGNARNHECSTGT